MQACGHGNTSTNTSTLPPQGPLNIYIKRRPKFLSAQVCFNSKSEYSKDKHSDTLQHTVEHTDQMLVAWFVYLLVPVSSQCTVFVLSSHCDSHDPGISACELVAKLITEKLSTFH